MKKRKERKKMTRKQLIILIIVTIILGVLCYFLSTEITKDIIDRKTMEEKFANEDFSDLRELDTISNITLQDLINNYNELSDDDIDINNISDNVVDINDINIEFSMSGENVNIISINFNKKNNNVKKLISDMVIASNDNITEETTDLIYDKVFETLGFTNDENSETSEFFQYQGLEFSLKEYKESDYKYSFRIGRILEKEQSTEEATEEE